MHKTLSIAVLALCASLSVSAAEAAQGGPVQLTNSQLDGVTAGIQLNLGSVALASGGTFVITSTNGGGSSSHTTVPGGGYVESGVIGGTASAVGTSGTSTSTGVSTSGSVGSPLVNSTTGGTVVGAGGQASIGFTYVSGGTYFLP